MDFTQTDKQADGPINFIMDESVPKFMLGLYLTRDMPGIIMNAGFVRALGEKKAPGLCCADITSALGRSPLFRVNAIFGCLAQAMNEQDLQQIVDTII